MDYKKIVKIIKKVTGLYEVPVYFNDISANCHGSPYFDIGDHAWDIIPEDLLDNPMFDVVDFITNKEIGLYHIGLPKNIIRDNKEFEYKITNEQLKSNGIKLKLTKDILETFIILHEFGHAHELFIKYNKNVEKYISETIKETSYNSYIIKIEGLGGTEEGLKIHKLLSTEKYADQFAIKYLPEVLPLIY